LNDLESGMYFWHLWKSEDIVNITFPTAVSDTVQSLIQDKFMSTVTKNV